MSTYRGEAGQAVSPMAVNKIASPTISEREALNSTQRSPISHNATPTRTNAPIRRSVQRFDPACLRALGDRCRAHIA
jgi:hypothetical protein